MANKTCIHSPVCKYANGMYCTGEKCNHFKDKSRCIELPLEIGDTFIGLTPSYCDEYPVYGFTYGIRRGEDENVLIVNTIYGQEFVWGEEAFASKKEMNKYIDNLLK